MSDQVIITPSVTPDPWQKTNPLPYTSNPWRLLASDIALYFQQAWSLPYIILPLYPWKSGPLDELYPSAANIFNIAVQTILSILQMLFMISVPLSVILPVPPGIILTYILLFLGINYLLCLFLLNGFQRSLVSNVDLSRFPKHENEKWFFINGVAGGQHWVQSCIDRIALSFGRPVHAIHNPTSGIVFDLVQCIVQRDFTYVTQDIREAYAELKQALNNTKYDRIILILYSQGGIEGGLAVDWLLAEAPGALMGKLEIYTFGSAANHFNNPQRMTATESGQQSSATNGVSKDLTAQNVSNKSQNVIGHIEHYANSLDFVSRWGVLHFDSWKTHQGRNNRYKGQLFERIGGGHQFVQHYMDTMFPLDTQRGFGLLEQNAFVDSNADVDDPAPDGYADIPSYTHVGGFEEDSAGLEMDLAKYKFKRRVRRVSRLWQYRNGGTPKET